MPLISGKREQQLALGTWLDTSLDDARIRAAKCEPVSGGYANRVDERPLRGGGAQEALLDVYLQPIMLRKAG